MSEIMTEVLSSVWALMREQLEGLPAYFRSRAALTMPNAHLPEAAQARKSRLPKIRGKLAIVQMHGMVLHRSPWWADYYGGVTSTLELGKLLDQLQQREDIAAVVLDVDSPGGTVTGVPELAEKIFALRDQKPVIAIANGLAASAAYWIGAAASQLVMIPSGRVGSVGVYQLHMDYSQANENFGVKPTYIYAGKYKVSGNFDQPLDEEAQGFMQETVDEVYQDFVNAVARYRGVTPKQVRETFGQGRVYAARQALEAGMVDKVMTLEEVIQGLGGEIDNSAKQLKGESDQGQLELMRLRWKHTKRKVS